jgi:hypothetical protein
VDHQPDAQHTSTSPDHCQRSATPESVQHQTRQKPFTSLLPTNAITDGRHHSALLSPQTIFRGQRCTMGAIAGANGGGRQQVVADIAKVLDGSGGHGESLDAGTEPARPLMGHSGGQRDRASARSPLGGSIGDTPAMLARVTLTIDEAARSRFALRPSGRSSLEDVAEAARTGSRSAFCCKSAARRRRIGRDASRRGPLTWGGAEGI